MKLRRMTSKMEDYEVFDKLSYYTGYSISIDEISKCRTEINPIDPPLKYEEYCTVLENDYKDYFLLENDDGRGIGIVTIIDEGDCIKIDEMIVDREYQLKGIGRIFFQLIESKAKTEGKEEIILTCYFPGAIIFWEKMGFKQEGFVFVKKL